uniref:Uncharacterized protein n=1 Tax=Arundo donax TaxID=35708 RepID=A0A0A9HBB4_ARUDO
MNLTKASPVKCLHPPEQCSRQILACTPLNSHSRGRVTHVLPAHLLVAWVSSDYIVRLLWQSVLLVLTQAHGLHLRLRV